MSKLSRKERQLKLALMALDAGLTLESKDPARTDFKNYDCKVSEKVRIISRYDRKHHVVSNNIRKIVAY